MTSTERPFDVESSSTFLFLASYYGGLREGCFLTAGQVGSLCLSGRKSLRPLPCRHGFLQVAKGAGKTFNVEIALIKSNSSCFSIMATGSSPYSFDTPSKPEGIEVLSP